MIQYGKQCIEEEDIQSVIDVLKSDYVTTGPKVDEFEDVISEFTGSPYAIAVSSGTAALHAMMAAIEIKAGDEVIVPTMTFAASANAVVYQGGIPVFADVNTSDLLIDVDQIEHLISPRTKAILVVDYAGKPCDYDRLRKIADWHGIYLMADSCHSLGGKYKGRKVGVLADLTALSFHPVKQITTGEGGMVLTDDKKLAEKMKHFRNHGITTDYRQREEMGGWYYEMKDLGFNYRITDFQCALGISQLHKLARWIELRQKIAAVYDKAFAGMAEYLEPLKVEDDIYHAYHLYVVRIKNGKRDDVFKFLRDKNIGVNVHYIPVHLHPYYTTIYGSLKGLCYNAETVYKEIITLPIYPQLSDEEQQFVIDMVTEAVKNI